ncbi:MAG: hypothetical protein JNN32_02105 [Flavobacteriales bacterium]|nr:hypothetical protein [Flavobacteriales bacterium]
MERITTQLADMVLSEDGTTIEVHYRAGLDLNVEGLMEVQLRRRELTTARCAMIGFFQAGTLSDLAVMKVDYFGLTNANEQITALAIVTQDDLGASMSSIYYTYHPQTFPTRIFRNGDEARAWIKEVMG